MGGGGRFVPFIGDTQQFSSISCCKMDKYEAIMQNSSRVMYGESQFPSSGDTLVDIDDSDSSELIGDDSWRFEQISRTRLKIRLRLSHEIRSFL